MNRYNYYRFILLLLIMESIGAVEQPFYPHMIIVDVVNDSYADILLRSPEKDRLAGRIQEPFVLKRSAQKASLIFLGMQDESYFIEMCRMKELVQGYCEEVISMPINVSFDKNRLCVSYDSQYARSAKSCFFRVYDTAVAVIRVHMRISPTMDIIFTTKHHVALSPWQIIRQGLISALDMSKMGLNPHSYTRAEYNLWLALKAHNKSAVERALVAGAFIDVQDETGKTPLMYAIEQGDFEIADMLLNFKPNLYVADQEGSIALDYARMQCPHDLRIRYMQKTKNGRIMSFNEFNKIPHCAHIWKHIHDNMNSWQIMDG